jgi:hypothetical protein
MSRPQTRASSMTAPGRSPPLWMPSSAHPPAAPAPAPAPVSLPPAAREGPPRRRAISAMQGERRPAGAASAIIAVAASALAASRRAKTAVASKRTPVGDRRQQDASDSDVLEVFDTDADSPTLERMERVPSPPSSPHRQRPVISVEPPQHSALHARPAGQAVASMPQRPVAARPVAFAAAPPAGVATATAAAAAAQMQSMPAGLRGKSAPSPRDEAAPAVLVGSIAGRIRAPLCRV